MFTPILQRAHELMNEILKNVCFNLDTNDPISSQFCTYHNSWAVVACAKLWPDLANIFHIRATHTFTTCGLWAPELFMKLPLPNIHRICKRTQNQWGISNIELQYIPKQCHWTSVLIIDSILESTLIGHTPHKLLTANWFSSCTPWKKSQRWTKQQRSLN